LTEKKYKLDDKKDSDLLNEIFEINKETIGIDMLLSSLAKKAGRLKVEERRWFEKVKIRYSISDKNFEYLVYNHESKEITIKKQ